MTELAPKNVRNLVGRAEEPCVSIYLPSPGDGPALATGEVLARAEGLLSRHFPEAQPLGELTRELEERLARLGPGRGLGYFKSPTLESVLTLPSSTEPLAVVARSFHVKPLLDQLDRRPRFWLATVTGACLSLYESTGSRSTFRGAFAVDRSPLHLARAAERIGEILAASEPQPLVVAASAGRADVRQLLARLLPVTAELRLQGEEEDPFRLHRRAQACLASLHRARLGRVLAAYETMAPRGLASDAFAKVAAACAAGRVGTLLIERDVRLWGTVDRATGSTQLAPSQEAAAADCVLDDLAEMALRSGAEVHVLEAALMPSPSPVAAIFTRRRA